MKTPDDGDHPPTGIGGKVPTKTVAQADDERHWKALQTHPGYQRHEITGEVRETPKS